MNLKKIFDEDCEVACVKFGGFRRFIGNFKDETKHFLLYYEYLTLISHHAKGDPRKALMIFFCGRSYTLDFLTEILRFYKDCSLL